MTCQEQDRQGQGQGQGLDLQGQGQGLTSLRAHNEPRKFPKPHRVTDGHVSK